MQPAGEIRRALYVPGNGHHGYNPPMDREHKMPGEAFWTVVIVVVALAYPISFGPACWLTDRGFVDSADSGRLDRPILQVCVRDSGRLSAAVRWYGLLGTQKHLFIVEDDVLEIMFFGK